jgi:hypothetical protein
MVQMEELAQPVGEELLFQTLLCWLQMKLSKS